MYAKAMDCVKPATTPTGLTTLALTSNILVVPPFNPLPLLAKVCIAFVTLDELVKGDGDVPIMTGVTD